MNDSNPKVTYPKFNEEEKYDSTNFSQSSTKNDSSPLYPKIKPDPLMDNRLASIEGSQVVEDGYIWSHKNYKIKTSKNKGEDVRSVERRYSDFEWLLQQLIEKFPGVIIPPIPEKNPLTMINSESQEFSDHRKRGLAFFLEKMFRHKTLKYAEDFKIFILGQDSEFRNYQKSQEQQDKARKNSSLLTKLTSFADYIPANTTVSFFKNMFTNLMGEPPKGEKNKNDHEIDNYETHINLLETSINELIKHTNQLWTIEKEQAMMFLDMSSNFNDLAKSDKSNTLEIARELKIKTERGSEIQKNFSKEINESIEQRLKDLGRYVSSAKDTIRRRKELKLLIEKNENKLYELKRNRISANEYDILEKENEKK